MGDYNSRYANISSQEELDNLRQQQAQDVIDNNMLGDFNSEGHYVVDKSIINELIMTTKVVTSMYGDFRFCQSTKKFEGIGNIQFAVDFSPNPENGQSVAVLVLLEPMRECNGYITNTNGVSIARFVGNNDKNFVERALKYFNVFLPDEIDGATFIENDKDLHFSNILSRLSYLRSIKNLSDPYINKIEKESFNKKSKALSKDKKDGKDIIKDFTNDKESVTDKFIGEKDDDYYKLLNSLLDKALDKNSDKLDNNKELKESIKDIETNRRDKSKKVIDYNEQRIVEGNLSADADKIYNRKENARNSKGISPVAMFKEPKKSYKEIEQQENIQYVERDNAKESAIERGPRLFGNKNRYKEPKLDQENLDNNNLDNVENADGKLGKMPQKLSSRPSYMENNRYDEIKNNELKGEKLTTKPSPYSKNIDSTQQNQVSQDDKDSLIKSLLKGKYKENTTQTQQVNNQMQQVNNQTQQVNNQTVRPQNQMAQENVVTSVNPNKIKAQTAQQSSQTMQQTGQTMGQQKQQTAQQATTPQQTTQQTAQQPKTATSTSNKPQTTQTEQTQTQAQGYQNGQYPPHPYGRPGPYGYGPYGPYGRPGPYGYGPYGPYGYGPYGRHHHHNQNENSESKDDGDIFDEIFGDVKPGMFMPPPGMFPHPNGHGYMHGPEENQDVAQNPEINTPITPEPQQNTPGNFTPLDLDDTTIVLTPELMTTKPQHIDAHPLIQEDVIKQIFGSDVYEFTRDAEKLKGRQQTQQATKENEDENAFVFAYVKK